MEVNKEDKPKRTYFRIHKLAERSMQKVKDLQDSCIRVQQVCDDLYYLPYKEALKIHSPYKMQLLLREHMRKVDALYRVFLNRKRAYQEEDDNRVA